MPVRSKTRHDPPMPKPKRGPGMFAATDSGKKPHTDTLAYASKIGSKIKTSRKVTLTR